MLENLLRQVGDATRAITRRSGSELKVAEQRVVVYGSRVIGAEQLGEDLEELMRARGIHRPTITWERKVTDIKPAFFGVTPEEFASKSAIHTIPKGVVTFPEMRRYLPNGYGQAVDIYGSNANLLDQIHFHEIMALCNRYKVPCFQIFIEPGRPSYEEQRQILLDTLRALPSGLSSETD